jgi:hypothetical protein
MSKVSKKISIYVVDNGIQHDQNKICFNWNYEPEENEKLDKLLDELSDNNKNNICSKCLWFYDRTESSPRSDIILDALKVEHLYTDLTLLSDWFINNIIYGEFAREYNHDHGKSNKISIKHINYSYEKITKIGTAIRNRDIYALEETYKILNWCKAWLSKENMNISLLYFSNF